MTEAALTYFAIYTALLLMAGLAAAGIYHALRSIVLALCERREAEWPNP